MQKIGLKYLDEYFLSLSFSHKEFASNKYLQTEFLKRIEYSKTTKTKSVYLNIWPCSKGGVLLTLIRWMAIYPLDGVIHLLNNLSVTYIKVSDLASCYVELRKVCYQILRNYLIQWRLSKCQPLIWPSVCIYGRLVSKLNSIHDYWLCCRFKWY